MEHRLDVGRITEYRETADGFLDLHVSFSKIGPLVYQRVDGTLETEYLTEEELFNEDSLATATGKPVTYLHPPEWVNKDNARKYTRGSTGTKIIKDTPFATILATVHDGELIDVIKSGKAKQVSAGYTTKVKKGDDGKLYQTGRVYNHIAVVPLGRAGDSVKVHYDSIPDLAYQVTDEDKQDTTMPTDLKTPTTIAQLKLDDKTTIQIGTSEGEQAIARYLRDALDDLRTLSDECVTLQKKADGADKLKTDLTAVTTERDQHKARADVAEAKLTELKTDQEKKTDDAALKSAFDSGYQRHVLEVTAVKFLPDEVKLDAAMSSKDIKLAVIKNQLKLKTDSDESKHYDSQSEAYVDAAYDLITKQDSSVNLRVVTASSSQTQMNQDGRKKVVMAEEEEMVPGYKKPLRYSRKTAM